MKILINTASTYRGGGVQSGRSFIEECRNHPEHEYHIVLGNLLSELINENEFPDNFRFYKIGYRPATRVFSLKSHDGDLKRIEEKVQPDVVFTTSGPSYWRPKAPHLAGYNLPHYIYKDSPFFSQIPFRKRVKWELKGRTIKYFFKRDADAYVVQTEDVNQRLRNWIKKERVYTVSNTCSQDYDFPNKVANKLPERREKEFRFLTLSAWYHHKNLPIIPKVIEALPPRVKDRVRFVLTLAQEDYQNNFSEETNDNIINIGPVKPDEGPALYQECDALFLPTLLECFSASYAEAMKMGKPIITSDLGFAHTVCGDAALYADPMNPEEIADQIVELIENPSLQQKLIQKGSEQKKKFATAKERAEKYLGICKQLVEEKNKERKVVVVNQAVNYLTIGLCNAFSERFENVALITGSIHKQGEELDESVRVTKINHWIERPAYKKMISYLRACVQIYVLLLTKYRKHEVFFITLPPMAYLMSVALPNRCSILIWDIYPDVFKITGMKDSHPLYRVWAGLNKMVFKRAFKIYTIGHKMADSLSKYVSREKILTTPIWSIFQSNGKVEKEKNPFIKQEGLAGKFIVQYSGNIGLTHNVEVMVELAEMLKDYEDILFQIIGRGPRVPALKKLVEDKGLPNCQFLPFQSDEMFPYSLSAADLGVVILDEVTSKGSVPSKSYNLMSYGIPSLYIASKDSELYDYANKYEHAKCFSHNNLGEAAAFILRLRDNEEIRNKYSRNALKASKNYRRSNADDIVALYLNENTVSTYVHERTKDYSYT